jgi:hypothetical protein
VETVGRRALSVHLRRGRRRRSARVSRCWLDSSGVGIDQPGDLGIHAGRTVIFGVLVVVVALVVLAVRGRMPGFQLAVRGDDPDQLVIRAPDQALVVLAGDGVGDGSWNSQPSACLHL